MHLTKRPTKFAHKHCRGSPSTNSKSPCRAPSMIGAAGHAIWAHVGLLQPMSTKHHWRTSTVQAHHANPHVRMLAFMVPAAFWTPATLAPRRQMHCKAQCTQTHAQGAGIDQTMRRPRPRRPPRRRAARRAPARCARGRSRPPRRGRDCARTPTLCTFRSARSRVSSRC